MGQIKDENWTTVGVVAAGYLSSTFGSSTQTDTAIDVDGCYAIKFSLLSVTLGTATQIRVTPALVDKAGNVTYPYKRGGTPIYWPLTATGQETPPYKLHGAYQAYAELWVDKAAGATGAASVQAIRIKK